MVYSLLEFSEDVTKFFPWIHSICLPENENIVALEDISKAKKIDQLLKIYELYIKCTQNCEIYIDFSKIPMTKILFTCSGMEARMKLLKMLKPLKVMMNVRNTREVPVKMESGYVALYVISGTMKTVFMSNFSHPVILLD